ncbi:MAG: hypothetical protein KGJ73_11740 [Rhodospirillales bacterium]|nr:hypothetical protein [Rhodospirillales bacterium]
MNKHFRSLEAFGVNIMKFTLTFDGELRSNGTPQQKSNIRQYLDPQLQELWKISEVLKYSEINRFVPTSPGFPVWEVHHSADEKVPEFSAPDKSWIDLLAPIERGGKKFIPLVRNSMALRCGLKITFLRKEDPGKVYQGGDLDNRLKTLFDALAIPNIDQIPKNDPLCPETIYCLMEDDSLISGVSIETHRLLSAPNGSKHDVRLVIEVDVRVALPRMYNAHFLGD